MSNELKRADPPRFVTRTLIATLAMVAFVLSAVLIVVTLTVRDHVRQSVIEKLETGQRLIATLASEEYAVRPLLHEGDAAVYVLDSIDASARPLVASSLQTMGGIALGAFGLAAIASLWLARTISHPIGTLSSSLTEMTRMRTFDRPLAPTGASLEVDSLAGAFNTMMESIKA